MAPALWKNSIVRERKHVSFCGAVLLLAAKTQTRTMSDMFSLIKP